MVYDLAVIGGGWAGFSASLKAKEFGLEVCLIEKGQIGGTCLNRGCIPTKTLIHSAKVYNLCKKAANLGIDIKEPPRINFIKIQERKDKIIQQLRQGMQFMLKGIDVLNAPAKFLSNNELEVGRHIIRSKFILIATGSKPVEALDEIRFDGKRILSSDDFLNLKEMPASLLIIGGGVIGCEFASLFSNLGSQVSIVEKMPQLLPGEDREIARRIENIFKKKGIKVNTNTDAKAIDLKNYDLVLLCIGRVPQIEDLGLEELGINLERGKVMVDEYLRTNIANVYAAGDCTAKVMLAHYAAYQGRLAAENISGHTTFKKIESINIPNCIFTDPEIASIGLNEEIAIKEGVRIKINKFDFLGSSMARILDETEGFIKIITDTRSQEIIGASIIGPHATELIGIFTIALSTRLRVSQVKDILFAHPTLSESIAEALKG